MTKLLRVNKKNTNDIIVRMCGRYWNVKLWNKLYDSLLNIPSCNEQPSLSELRQDFEQDHQANINTFISDKKHHDVMLFNL